LRARLSIEDNDAAEELQYLNRQRGVLGGKEGDGEGGGRKGTAIIKNCGRAPGGRARNAKRDEAGWTTVGSLVKLFQNSTRKLNVSRTLRIRAMPIIIIKIAWTGNNFKRFH
jgi:hypothetical protein